MTKFEKPYRTRNGSEHEDIITAAIALIHALDFLTFSQRDICFKEYSNMIDAINAGLISEKVDSGSK